MPSYPTHFQATGVNQIDRWHGTFRYFYLAGVKHYNCSRLHFVFVCILVFVGTANHFGLLIRMSVACNLPKSVLLNIKQLIVSSS